MYEETTENRHFRGCSATVKRLAPPEADLHPLKWLRVCKEWFCIEWYAKGKTIIPFCTSGSTGISGSLSEIKNAVPDSTVKDGFRGTASMTESAIKTQLENNGYVFVSN